MAKSSPETLILISGATLLESIASIAGEIAAMKPLRFPLRKISLSTIRKAKLLSVVFFDGVTPAKPLPSSAALSLEEIHIALQRAKALIQSSIAGSALSALMKSANISGELRELSSELATLLDIFPAREVGLRDDVAELLNLAKKRLSDSEEVDPGGEELRREAAAIMEGIEREIAPDREKLKIIFEKIGVSDSSSFRDEIEKLMDERDDAATMLGLVQYAKCVLFGASAPAEPKLLLRRASEASVAVPADFLCPITMELMKDPVVAATGQTYDREAIQHWIDSGHRTCPKSGLPLAHTEFIPNHALRSLIVEWCRVHRVSFEVAGESRPAVKAAIGATKLTAAYLVERLAGAKVDFEIGGVLYEIRAMAKTDAESRECVAAAGAVPLIVRHLASSVDSTVKVNAVTALLNLSLLDANKDLIMETEGAAAGVAAALTDETATWEARGNAAAAIFSLSTSSSSESGGAHNRRRKLGNEARVAKGLVEAVRVGPARAKKDALAAVASLAGDGEACFRLVEAGAVEAAADVAAADDDDDDEVAEAAVLAAEAVVKKGGMPAAAAAFGAVKKLAKVMTRGVGSERARESAAAALAAVCKRGGAEAVAELAAVEGIESAVGAVVGTGTPRGRRKAATLMRLIRRSGGGDSGSDYYHMQEIFEGHWDGGGGQYAANEDHMLEMFEGNWRAMEAALGRR